MIFMTKVVGINVIILPGKPPILHGDREVKHKCEIFPKRILCSTHNLWTPSPALNKSL
jgi:hypothetical protein